MRDMAVITPQGIKYLNEFYTCTKAISEQWFSQASPFYMAEIPVSFEYDLLFVILGSGELISASRISTINKLSSNELVEYFTKLNQLKSELRTINHEKS